MSHYGVAAPYWFVRVLILFLVATAAAGILYVCWTFSIVWHIALSAVICWLWREWECSLRDTWGRWGGGLMANWPCLIEHLRSLNAGWLWTFIIVVCDILRYSRAIFIGPLIFLWK